MDVQIIQIENDDDLYCKYSTQINHQPVYLSLDLLNGYLTCEINYEINAIPIDVFYDKRKWFGPIAPLKAKPANQMLEEFKPLAQEMLDLFEEEETISDLEIEAMSFIEDYQKGVVDQDQVWEPWSFDLYLNAVSLSEMGLSSSSSKEEIRQAAKTIFQLAEVPLEGDEDDLVDYLSQWCQDEDN